MKAADRTAQLLAAALYLAARGGLDCLTHAAIAYQASVSPGLVVARLGTARQIRRSVMRAAVDRRILPIVAEGLALRDPHALRADLALRLAAAELVRTAT